MNIKNIKYMVAVSILIACLPAYSQAIKIIQENTFGCITETAFNDTKSYLQNKEELLFKKQFSSGKCDLLSKGEQVILVDIKFMDYAIVRRKNEETKYFTFQSTFK